MSEAEVKELELAVESFIHADYSLLEAVIAWSEIESTFNLTLENDN